MITNSRSVDKIEENGKIYRRIDCKISIANPGHYTDVFQSEDGKIIYKERLKNNISMPSHVRNNLEGSLKSISMSLSRIIEGALKGCDKNSLNTLILQSQHHIDNTEKHFSKQAIENSNELFVTAIEESVNAIVDEKEMNLPCSQLIPALKSIIEADQIKLERNIVLKKAFDKRLEKMIDYSTNKESKEENSETFS